MFERFTQHARQAVVFAQEESGKLDHDYIGTEHILLGIIREREGVAARALESVGMSLESVRADVEATVGRGTGRAAGHIPFTPRAKKVLELSLREALQLDNHYIGTEHILLGLLREGEGVAAEILGRHGATLEPMRAKVMELVSAGVVEEGVESPPERPAGRRPPSAMPLFDERVVGAIRVAETLAARTGRDVLTGRDVFLGLLGAEDDEILDILARLGVERASVADRAAEIARELVAREEKTTPPADDEQAP